MPDYAIQHFSKRQKPALLLKPPVVSSHRGGTMRRTGILPHPVVAVLPMAHLILWVHYRGKGEKSEENGQ